MKTLQQLREKSHAGHSADYDAPDDDDKESTGSKYRAKGEQEFADSHKRVVKKHPVAPDDQFTGGTKPGDDHDLKPLEGKGEKKVIKQGSSDVKNVHDGSKKADSSPAARKRVGDLMAVKQGSSKIKEEYVPEGVMDDLQKIAKRHQAKRVKFANGKTEMVDAFSASAITQVYEKVNRQNRQKMAKTVETLPGFMKIMDFAMSKTGGR